MLFETSKLVILFILFILLYSDVKSFCFLKPETNGDVSVAFEVFFIARKADVQTKASKVTSLVPPEL